MESPNKSGRYSPMLDAYCLSGIEPQQQFIIAPPLQIGFQSISQQLSTYSRNTSGATTYDSKLPGHMKTLEKIKALETGWDGSDAEPPTALTIQLAEQGLEIACEQLLRNFTLTPILDGGIALSFRKDDKYASLQFLNEGEQLVVTSIKGETPTVFPVGSDLESLRNGLETIGAFIG